MIVEEKWDVQNVDAFEDIVDYHLAMPRCLSCTMASPLLKHEKHRKHDDCKDGGKGVHHEARIARG